jgi:hypothetical protein
MVVTSRVDCYDENEFEFALFRSKSNALELAVEGTRPKLPGLFSSRLFSSRYKKIVVTCRDCSCNSGRESNSNLLLAVVATAKQMSQMTRMYSGSLRQRPGHLAMRVHFSLEKGRHASTSEYIGLRHAVLTRGECDDMCKI